MKKLIFGQISDDFDPSFMIPISPICFIGREHIFSDFESMDYLKIVQNRYELKAFDKLTSEESLFLINKVAQKYNPKIFDKYSFQFWKTIYYPFLGQIIPWLFRKQILAQKILNKYGNENIKISLVNDLPNIEFKNEFHFIIDGLWNPEVNEWVFSQIILSKLPNNWIPEYKTIKLSTDTLTLDQFIKKKSYKDSISNHYKRIFHRSVGVYGFKLWHEIYFHFLLRLKPKIKANRIKNKQFERSKINWDFDIEEIIDKLLPESLKRIEIRQGLLKNIIVGKLSNYSNRLYYEIESKISAAITYECKSIVIATQHGGHNYGSALTFEYGNIIEYQSDYFISWGHYSLSNGLRNNVVALPSPLLSKHLNSYHRKNNKLILVGTNTNCFISKFEPIPDEVTMLNYRKNKLIFIENLKINSGIWYRPHFNKSTSLLDWEYVSDNSKKILKLDGNLHEEMRKCRLLVLDHPGTTWNIAMAMNTPTICFWEREHFAFNQEADLFLDRFEELGLFFESPLKAAERVNVIMNEYDDLTEWWNQNEIQELRKEWMQAYAMASKDWFWVWTTALWNLGK